mmetsp:Transcript_30043/g.41876  ORF Transcript_30043/g.41876 Transcript_30043/m.41876 type:complete len:93 (+) Transcript_30043:360-638(+)
MTLNFSAGFFGSFAGCHLVSQDILQNFDVFVVDMWTVFKETIATSPALKSVLTHAGATALSIPSPQKTEGTFFGSVANHPAVVLSPVLPPLP